jgi:hypothetical protein
MMIEARELYLYAINDGDLYRQQREHIESNLRCKFMDGVYDSEKAATLWLRFADNAAQKYHKEFCGNRRRALVLEQWIDIGKEQWFKMFNIDARREVATLMESEHHSEMKIQAAEYNRDLDDYDFAHGIN